MLERFTLYKVKDKLKFLCASDTFVTLVSH